MMGVRGPKLDVRPVVGHGVDGESNECEFHIMICYFRAEREGEGHIDIHNPLRNLQ